MKRNSILSLLLATPLFLAGCTSNLVSSSNTPLSIQVYTRDATSGTRDGLQAILGFSGSEMIATAVEVSSNGDMINKIKNDENGIGYISLSTLGEATSSGEVKALSFESITASEANVLNNTYQLKRPFNYVTRQSGTFDSNEKEQLVVAFLSFLTDTFEGKSSISSKGGIVDINIDTDKTWADDYASTYQSVCTLSSVSPVKIVGSTSVESTINQAATAFSNVCSSFDYQLDLTGSGDGHKRVLGVNKDSAYGDIGFASRSFSTTEDVTAALNSGTYALDAIVIVVGKNVMVENITKADAKDVFTGIKTTWNE